MKLVPIACAVAVGGLTIWRWTRVGWLVRVGGAASSVALVLYGAGIVRLPQLETMVGTIGSTLGPYTYALVGVMAFLETAAFAGLVVPGETVVILGGVIAGQGDVDVLALFALTWFCALSGDATGYLLGRRLGRRFLLAHGPRVHLTGGSIATGRGVLRSLRPGDDPDRPIRRTGSRGRAVPGWGVSIPAGPLHRDRGARHRPVERRLRVPGLHLLAVIRRGDRHRQAGFARPRDHRCSHRLRDRYLPVRTRAPTRRGRPASPITGPIV